MPIDHASREPDDTAPPDDPPPISPATRAFTNLFTRATEAARGDTDAVSASSPTDATQPTDGPPIDAPPIPDILRQLTWAAVIIHGGQRNGKLTSASFGRAVQERFDLRETPEPAWCRRVLRGLPYVTVYPGGDSFRVQTG